MWVAFRNARNVKKDPYFRSRAAGNVLIRTATSNSSQRESKVTAVGAFPWPSNFLDLGGACGQVLAHNLLLCDVAKSDSSLLEREKGPVCNFLHTTCYPAANAPENQCTDLGGDLSHCAWISVAENSSLDARIDRVNA